MTDSPAMDGSPLQCPLCGGANDCGMIRNGSAAGPCWCTKEKFSPALLARIPEQRRDKACVCKRCVEAQ